jgi:hypothetical protein
VSIRYAYGLEGWEIAVMAQPEYPTGNVRDWPTAALRAYLTSDRAYDDATLEAVGNELDRRRSRQPGTDPKWEPYAGDNGHSFNPGTSNVYWSGDDS